MKPVSAFRLACKSRSAHLTLQFRLLGSCVAEGRHRPCRCHQSSCHGPAPCLQPVTALPGPEGAPRDREAAPGLPNPQKTWEDPIHMTRESGPQLRRRLGLGMCHCHRNRPLPCPHCHAILPTCQCSEVSSHFPRQQWAGHALRCIRAGHAAFAAARRHLTLPDCAHWCHKTIRFLEQEDRPGSAHTSFSHSQCQVHKALHAPHLGNP